MKSCLIIFSLLFVSLSCKKNDVVEIPPPDNTAIKKYLSKILITDLSTNKTTRILEWKYDDLKRCLEATERSISPPLRNPGDTVLERKYIFYYSNSELLPYRIYAPPHVRIENLANDVFVKYLADGRKYLDSCIYTDPGWGSYLKTVNYKYEGQMMYATFKQTNINWTGPTAVFGTGYDTAYISNNNTSKVIQADPINRSSNGIGLYQYDEKINPFNQLNIASSFYVLGPDYHYSKWIFWNDNYDLLGIIGGNKNNITQKSVIWGSNAMMSFSYTYDQDNYPKSIRISGGSYADLRLDLEFIN